MVVFLFKMIIFSKKLIACRMIVDMRLIAATISIIHIFQLYFATLICLQLIIAHAILHMKILFMIVDFNRRMYSCRRRRRMEGGCQRLRWNVWVSTLQQSCVYFCWGWCRGGGGEGYEIKVHFIGLRGGRRRHGRGLYGHPIRFVNSRNVLFKRFLMEIRCVAAWVIAGEVFAFKVKRAHVSLQVR